MTSTQKTYSFMYAAQPYEIPCTGKEPFKEIIIKFLEIFNKDSQIRDYNYYFKGKLIEPNTYDKPLNDDKNVGSIIITVEKNLKIIKCPKCNYDDCVVSLSNYKTTFYNCEHKHLEISSYDNYFTDQIYYPEKIICAGNNGKKTGKTAKMMCMCLTCSKMTNRTKSICSDCIEKDGHKDSNHFVINYEDKNYFCKIHCQRMDSYCFQCKDSLCKGCIEEHLKNKDKYKDHKIKSIEFLIPDEEELKPLYDSLDEIKKTMKSLKIIIDNIVYTLNGAMRIYENYFKIASHIVGKYETFNKDKDAFKNFTIFKCLRNLKYSNNQILEDLKSIISIKDKNEQAKSLIKIYDDKKKKYFADDRKGIDLNQEDDAQWYKEVCEREMRKKKENQEDIEKPVPHPKPKPKPKPKKKEQ